MRKDAFEEYLRKLGHPKGGVSSISSRCKRIETELCVDLDDAAKSESKINALMERIRLSPVHTSDQINAFNKYIEFYGSAVTAPVSA